MRITSIEQSQEACLAAVADTFVGGGEEAAYPIEGVTLASSVAQSLVGDSASYLVETLVREADDVERVSYLPGVGQYLLVGHPIRHV